MIEGAEAEEREEEEAEEEAEESAEEAEAAEAAEEAETEEEEEEEEEAEEEEEEEEENLSKTRWGLKGRTPDCRNAFRVWCSVKVAVKDFSKFQGKSSNASFWLAFMIFWCQKSMAERLMGFNTPKTVTSSIWSRCVACGGKKWEWMFC
jgi:flagellar biosynthesis GTPase FlhF